jgi:hypothetical protein
MVLARPFFIGKPVGAVQRLLIDAQNHGVGGRIDVKADDVTDLGGEARIVV